jgi:chaperone BCS1
MDSSKSLMGFARLALLGGMGTKPSTNPAIEHRSLLGSFQKLIGSSTKLNFTQIALILTFFGTISEALKSLQDLATKTYLWITKFFTASISVAPHDRLNREILNWVSTNVLAQRQTRILTARTEVVGNDTFLGHDHMRLRRPMRNDVDEKRYVRAISVRLKKLQ